MEEDQKIKKDAQEETKEIDIMESSKSEALLNMLEDLEETKKEVQESEERYSSLFHNMSTGFALHEIVTDKKGKPIDYVFLEVNESFEKLTGLKRVKLIGNKVTDVLPGIEKDPADWIGKYGKVALTGKHIQFENYAEPLNKWYSVNAYSPKKGYFAVLFSDITKRKNIEEEAKQRDDILVKGNQALSSLSKTQEFKLGDFSGFVKKVTETAAKILNIERVSLWLYNDVKSKIVTVDLYELSKNKHSKGHELESKKYPAYFNALKKNRCIPAIDATKDKATKEFTSSYLNPLNIKSMLDSRIELLGDPVGVLCHESVNNKREWTPEEQNFASSLSDLISLVLENNKMKEKEEKLKESEKRMSAWLENSPSCTKMVDLDFNLQYMSHSGVKDLKIKDITKFYGKPYPLYFYPNSFKVPMLKNMKKAKSTGKTIEQEAYVTDIKGNKVWFHSTIVPVKDDKGKIEYLLIISNNITERKKTEEKYKKKIKELEEKIKKQTLKKSKSISKNKKR